MLMTNAPPTATNIYVKIRPEYMTHPKPSQRLELSLGKYIFPVYFPSFCAKDPGLGKIPLSTGLA